MATYFESYNTDTGLIQIDDTYKTACVSRTGNLPVNLSSGQVYGLLLNDDEIFAGLRVSSGTLYQTPMVLCNGKRIVYATTDCSSGIDYFTYKMATGMPAQDHAAGIEIYNGYSELLFTSECQRATIEDHKNLPFKGSLSSADPDFYASNCWDYYETPDDGKKYVVAYEAPWLPRLWYYYINGHSHDPWEGTPDIYAAGFVFESGKIHTETSANKRYGGNVHTLHLSSVHGNGSLNQIGQVTHNTGSSNAEQDWWVWGISCYDYSFDILRLSN